MRKASGLRLRLFALASACGLVLVAGALLAVGSSAHAVSRHSGHKGAAGAHQTIRHGQMSITSKEWGTLSDGTAVDLYTLTNGHGMTVNISNYGGIVQSIWVRDRFGGLRNVALGFPANQEGLSQYETDFTNPPTGGSGDTYFGSIVGRYANRIANHSFTLDGHFYNLVGNNGPNNVNTLHGGPDAYNTQVWSATPTSGNGWVGLRLEYVDPNGKNGFPGTVTNIVTYALTRKNGLQIHYHATTDQPTVINLTNHTYFNLAGEGTDTVYHQLLAINANTYQPTDDVQIPTGQFAPVAGTPFDFRRLTPIGKNITRSDISDGTPNWTPQTDQLVFAHGYDHNWVLNGSGYRLAAVAEDPKNGIALLTYTDQPGIQLYTGNFLVGDLVGTSGRAYRQGSAFTLETQHFPDSPHHIGQAGWPSVVLNPGQVFSSTTTYQFTLAGHGFRNRVSF
jgi:aldose 1-epimerase